MTPAILAALPTIDSVATIHAVAARTGTIDAAMHECKSAWTRAHDLAKSKGYTSIKAQRMASVAYKIAMPKMNSVAGIKAAIACIAQGIQLEVFDGRDGSQLLYAAQVALSVHREKGRKKP
jgi:hypothetical protein